MSHFEEVLKVIGLMKNFASKCDPGVTQQTGNLCIISNCTVLAPPTTSGYITTLPASEELGNMLHASCSKIIEHIITQSSIAMETEKADSSGRNVSTTVPHSICMLCMHVTVSRISYLPQ